MFSNCIVHKELLIPAPGLTILVQPRPPETFLTHRLIQRTTYLKLKVHSLEETGQKEYNVYIISRKKKRRSKVYEHI